MRTMFYRTLLLVYLFSLPVAAKQQPSLGDITFYTEIYPPANYMVDDKLAGITVDTLTAIYDDFKLPVPKFEVVPWARGYRFTLERPNTALFTMSRTPSRENLFKWVGPIFNSTHVLIAKKSKNFKFTSLGQIFAHKVAAVRGDISEISLNQVGFPDYNMAKVSELKLAYKMMETNRVDMIVVTIHGFSHLAEQLNFDKKLYQQVWEVNKYGNYVAFNKQTPDSVIDQFQQSLNKISDKHQKIKSQYELPLAEY